MKDFNYVASPMNYIGGKFKLLPQILPLFPKKINKFVDLFCGGCNVAINTKANKIKANDNISYIMELYNFFKNRKISDILSHIEMQINLFNLSDSNQEGYINFRKFYNDKRHPLDLFVLMAYSFNHQIRFNSKHEFNNPFGKNRSSFNQRMKSNLLNFIERIQSIDIEFTSFNFDDYYFDKLNQDDFVYADPPYLITNGTYNDGKRGFTGWGVSEEEKLLLILDDLNRKKLKFALSNVIEHKGKINDLLLNWIKYNNYKIYYLNKNYSNSSYHTLNRDTTSTKEVLVTNY